MIWIARSTAPTVTMPPNPAFARLMNTVMSPLTSCLKRECLMTASRFGCHGKVLEIRVFGDTRDSRC